MGQSESDYICVSGMKAKELMMTGSSTLHFLFQWKNKNVDLFTMGSSIFGIGLQNKLKNSKGIGLDNTSMNMIKTLNKS